MNEYLRYSLMPSDSILSLLTLSLSNPERMNINFKWQRKRSTLAFRFTLVPHLAPVVQEE